MKKVLALAGLCLLLSGAIATTTQAAAQPVVSSEPEPHPNTYYVKLKLNGSTVILSLLGFSSDTVGDLKSELADILGVSADDITLRYNGTVLQDELTLGFYGIGAGAILSASVA